MTQLDKKAIANKKRAKRQIQYPEPAKIEVSLPKPVAVKKAKRTNKKSTK